MFIEAKDDGGGGDNWSYKSCKAPVKSSPLTNQHPVFYKPDSCRPSNSAKALKGKLSHSMDLTPSSPGGLPTLSLTTNSSWLPWGRVAMPLISPLMPVPQWNAMKSDAGKCPQSEKNTFQDVWPRNQCASVRPKSLNHSYVRHEFR